MNLRPRLSSLLLLLAFSTNAQTVDDIIGRHIAARGGARRLANLRAQSMTGTLGFAPNAGLPFHVEMKRPGQIHQEIALPKDQFIQVSDGKEGWTLRAGKPPEPMPASQVHDLGGSADMEGPLLHYREKGNRVEFAGRQTVEGRDAFKLVITMKDGTARSDFIDAKTYLELKWEGVVGGEKMETFFHDYRKVRGIAYSHSMDSSGPGFQQKLIFTKIEVNPVLPDSRFHKP